MARQLRNTVLLAMLAIAVSANVSAEIHGLEITLFAPCDTETAVKAAASLEAVPGVTKVDLVAGTLEVRVQTGPEFTHDPLELVQKLWEGKIYPNKIYLEASGRIDASGDEFVFVAAGTGQRFKVRDDAALRRLLTESLGALTTHIRAEVLDWIEDRRPEAGKLYTVRLLEHAGS